MEGRHNEGPPITRGCEHTLCSVIGDTHRDVIVAVVEVMVVIVDRVIVPIKLVIGPLFLPSSSQHMDYST